VLYDLAADVSSTLFEQEFPELIALKLTDSWIDSQALPPVGTSVVKMTVINQIMVEMVNVVARGEDGTQTTIYTPTPTPTLSLSATSSADTASTGTSSSGGNNTTQSPLLFFVALGFGVVFTNLWYAFNGDCPINLPFNTCVGSSSASSIASDTTLVTER
jgi:hypothetical protein